MKYRAVYERDDNGTWLVSAPEVKGCHTYGRTIEQARERFREALSLFVDDADTAEITDHVQLPQKVRRQVNLALVLRQRIADSEKRMVRAQCQAVHELRAEMKLGHRDAGYILNLSHQRVQQLEQRTLEKIPGGLAEEFRAPRRSIAKRASKKR